MLNCYLSDYDYMVGSEYLIVDIVVWFWYGSLVFGYLYDVVEFLDVELYSYVICWVK